MVQDVGSGVMLVMIVMTVMTVMTVTAAMSLLQLLPSATVGTIVLVSCSSMLQYASSTCFTIKLHADHL